MAALFASGAHVPERTLRSGSRNPPFSARPDLNLNTPENRTTKVSRIAVAFFRRPDYTPGTVSAHRLAVRTAPSHGANRGSIPLGRTRFSRTMGYSGRCRHPAATQAVKSVPGSIHTIRFEIARLAAVVLACCSLAVVSACTRTSDGSIELNRLELAQPRMPNLFKLRLPGSQAPQPAPVQIAAAQFPSRPPAPQQISRTEPAPAKARPRPRRATAAPQPAVSSKPATSAEPKKPLVCRNDTQAAGRIRIVCE
jgi:hypothetical protein